MRVDGAASKYLPGPTVLRPTLTMRMDVASALFCVTGAAYLASPTNDVNITTDVSRYQGLVYIARHIIGRQFTQ